jgi:hypothetical protein
MRLWELRESIVEETLHNKLRESVKEFTNYDQNLTTMVDRHGFEYVDSLITTSIEKVNQTISFFMFVIENDQKLTKQYNSLIEIQSKLINRLKIGI